MTGADSFWWYITLEGGSEQEEALSSLADLSGGIGSEEHEGSGKIRLRIYYRTSHDLGYWLELLNHVLESFPGISVVDMGKIENRQWHTEWKEAFPPLPVGEKFVVLAPWHRGSEPNDRIPLYIYPGSAFGTGYHESTQIALTLLERHMKPHWNIADIGTGSGILFIGAIRLGAGKVYARDLDPAVLNEVLNNMELNGIYKEEVDLKEGNLLQGFDHTVNLLMANIIIEPLMSMIPDVPHALCDGGIAIFSGLLTKEKDTFIETLNKAGLKIIDELERNDWWGVAVTKK
ncbi:MAG: 50S ribosomal protein L11 methyltransferase [Aminobacterium sp.]|jgi:ribosomal protein L11 methyltransferase|uniref:50S ribosomal protein L11 methyltransferase n=1 Tax=Aminobacterium sp. MB27-C1 TaxID=3070661 RepID=UPI001BCE55F1|nr:50S ribosomal protein L11 methyltransferase [Aminobacterium sp. MB27-C1]MDD2206192.1 50S ribosomal protein L11 methyltransferase [Aminobacterium sp.]MDD3426445.1 50S ribosomal protein L11 methyltransferase [Aminobacterium sp.]MDD3707091.1 50S ribosomal protein L11 methyltransferase [Aminobacterium sp.]MDD4227964.1 50S ribosomal protein L11 methyltransferase [Aminobacterium sp.]MDD4551189.1 50S ribosomal protein L11 methyltransferase [Aminobacterium sp.]